MTAALCTQCKQEKPADAFHKNGIRSSGRGTCKTCVNAAHKAWADANREKMAQYRRNWIARNPEKAKETFRRGSRRWYWANKKKVNHYYGLTRVRIARSLWRKCRERGITPYQYWELFDRQSGRCAICGREPKLWWSFNVDHCHATGHIRGLLCGPCNKALGPFGDDLEGLKRVVAYLEQPGVPPARKAKKP